jgi:hypothetical protein
MDVAPKKARKWPKLIDGGVKDTLPNGVQCVRWKLAKGSCSLWYCLKPEDLEEPPAFEGGHRRKMNILGMEMEQPRLSLAYDHAYSFSGQTHPIEDVTPPQIAGLYAWANAACGVPAGDVGFNMDLCNHYPSGWHCIHAHSDDERQFGALHDVVCFVSGPAARRIVIRDKETKAMVLSGPMPSGVYCMAGRDFQTYYTHEFPRIHDALFKRVVERAPGWFGDPDFWLTIPSKEKDEWLARYGEELLPHLDPKKVLAKFKPEIAEWLALHGEEILPHLDPKKEAPKWKEWMQWRTSHTLRSFAETK